MPLTTITQPAEEPVSLSDLKAHLRVDGAEEDSLITGLLTAAREAAEQYCGRVFVERKMQLTEEAFPPPGRLLALGLPSISAVHSITYVDAEGITQPWPNDHYQVDKVRGRVRPAAGMAWPVTAQHFEAVTVIFTAGAANAAAVPQIVKAALTAQVTEWFERREQTALSEAVKRMLGSQRVWSVL